MIISRAEKVYVYFSLILLILFWLGMLDNILYHHYAVPVFWMGTCFSCWLFFTVAYFFLLQFSPQKNTSQQILRCLKTAVLACTAAVFIGMYNLLTSCTPYSMHDYFISNMDHMVGFHLLPILSFMYYHPDIRTIVFILYFFSVIAYGALPFFLTLTEKTEKSAIIFYTAANIALVIGSAIFYFFPTMTSPAAIYPHHYFIPFQLNTLHAFQLEHAHQIPDFVFLGSIISFPSFHMIWITMITYFLWPTLRKWAIFFAAIQVYAVLFTGWHYFVDMIAGFIIAYASIKISEYFIVGGRKISVII